VLRLSAAVGREDTPFGGWDKAEADLWAEHGLSPRWTAVLAARGDWRSAGPVRDWRDGDVLLGLRRALRDDPDAPLSVSLALMRGEVPGLGVRTDGVEARLSAGRRLPRDGFAQAEIAYRQWRRGAGQTRLDAAAGVGLTGRWHAIASLNGETSSLTGARSGARLRAGAGIAASIGEAWRLEVAWRETLLADDDWKDAMATVTIQSRF
jgi:hypothetical protein